MDLVVLRPTRGLEFSESSSSIDLAIDCAKRLGLIRWGCILRTWDKSIPESFNHLVAYFLALPNRPDLAWFVEEDVVVPPDAIQRMLAMDADITAINYPLKVGGPGRLSELRDHAGRLYTVSMGCTLIHRHVFIDIKAPWFRTDLTPGFSYRGSSQANPEPALVKSDAEYGGHDGYFTMRAQQAGMIVKTVPGIVCRHLKIGEMGPANQNSGCHQIEDVQ